MQIPHRRTGNWTQDLLGEETLLPVKRCGTERRFYFYYFIWIKCWLTKLIKTNKTTTQLVVCTNIKFIYFYLSQLHSWSPSNVYSHFDWSQHRMQLQNLKPDSEPKASHSQQSAEQEPERFQIIDLSLLQLLSAFFTLELLKWVGQEGQHAPVYVPANRDDVRNCLPAITELTHM